MTANAWASTWARSCLAGSGVPVNEYTLKAMALWNKSTPTEPWSMNPIGIPSKGFTRRSVPHTPYALFLKYADFSTAFSKALSSEQGLSVKAQLMSGDSIAKLWRAIRELNWPGVDTESDYPAELHTWIGDQYRDKLNIPTTSPRTSSGTRSRPQVTNHEVMQTHHRMVTAAQAKLDLTEAIRFITGGGKHHGR